MLLFINYRRFYEEQSMIAHREAIHEGKRSNTINTYTEEDEVEDPPQNDIDENDYVSTGVESKTDNPEFIANRLKDLDQEGYVDVSEKKVKKEIWSHFLVNEILGVAICKYCLRKFKLVIKYFSYADFFTVLIYVVIF